MSLNDKEIDLVDEEGNFLRTVSMRETYAQGMNEGEYRRYVHILAFNSKNELVLPFRSSKLKKFPSTYDFSVAKHLKSGEDYEEGAREGLKDELGVEKEIESIGKLGPRDGMSGFMQVYRTEVEENELENFDRDQFDRIEFHSVDEVMKMIEEDETKFKDDFVKVLRWYVKYYIEKN